MMHGPINTKKTELFEYSLTEEKSDGSEVINRRFDIDEYTYAKNEHILPCEIESSHSGVTEMKSSGMSRLVALQIINRNFDKPQLLYVYGSVHR